MTNLDLFILAIYLLCVAYVLYQAYAHYDKNYSIDMLARVQVDQTAIAQQLEGLGIPNALNVRFNFKPSYQFDGIKDLVVNIDNRYTYPVFVDWDYCTLTDFGGRSRRVIRLTPGMKMDLFQQQAFSAIEPGRTLIETLVAEDMLKWQASTEAWEIVAPLININRLVGQKAYIDFVEMKTPLSFSLRLALRVYNPDSGIENRRIYLLCQFAIHKLPRTRLMPWEGKR